MALKPRFTSHGRRERNPNRINLDSKKLGNQRRYLIKRKKISEEELRQIKENAEKTEMQQPPKTLQQYEVTEQPHHFRERNKRAHSYLQIHRDGLSPKTT